MSERLWSKLALIIRKAGTLPLPASDTLIEILKNLITEEQATFLLIFKKSPVTIEQIKQKAGLDDRELNKLLDDLMHIGIITRLPEAKTGDLIYKLAPFMPELFERTLMRGGTTEKERQLVHLYEKLFTELTNMVQNNYDLLIPEFKNSTPWFRVVPVEEEVKIQQQIVLPYEEISKIVQNKDIIGVGHCYCRHKKDLVGDPCKLNASRETCLFFGDLAQFLMDHDFIRSISKEEALKILKRAEECGLVHNTFYNLDDPEYKEVAICSCCKCCCVILSLYHSGLAAVNALTSYLAKTHPESCLGCGTCVEICPMNAIELIDTKSSLNEDRCIGCGLCAYHCPEHSMELIRIGLKSIFIPPPKLINI
jgi:ferredoxin/predicted transcriptional regulator